MAVRCEDLIEDAAVRDLMLFCQERKLEIAKDSNMELLCGALHFVFKFPYKDKKIPILVERYGKRIVHQGNLRVLNDLNNNRIENFLSPFVDPANQILPSIGFDRDSDGNKVKSALVRFDLAVDDDNPEQNRLRLLKTLIKLKFFLDGLPPDFLNNPLN